MHIFAELPAPILSQFDWSKIRWSTNFLSYGNVDRRIWKSLKSWKGRSGRVVKGKIGLSFPSLFSKFGRRKGRARASSWWSAKTNKGTFIQIQDSMLAKKPLVLKWSYNLTKQPECEKPRRYEIRWSPDCEAVKLRKGRSGCHREVKFFLHSKIAVILKAELYGKITVYITYLEKNTRGLLFIWCKWNFNFESRKFIHFHSVTWTQEDFLYLKVRINMHTWVVEHHLPTWSQFPPDIRSTN